MAVIQLKGSRRDGLGKGAARKARAAGQIPAVIYGHGREPQKPVPMRFSSRFPVSVRPLATRSRCRRKKLGTP